MTRHSKATHDKHILSVSAYDPIPPSHLTPLPVPQTKELYAVDDGVGMTAAERGLNQRLLNAAERVVGQTARQLTVRY